MSDKTQLMLRLPQELYDQLRMTAFHQNRSMNYLCVQAIEQLVRDAVQPEEMVAPPIVEDPCKCDHGKYEHHVVGDTRTTCKRCGCISYRPAKEETEKEEPEHA